MIKTNMKKLMLFLIIMLSLYAQASAETQKWHAKDIVGYKLTLIDKKTIESFTFWADQNLVSASIGTVGGPITAVLWYWKIDKNGILLIKDDDNKIWYRMKKLYEKKGRIGVELSGNKVEYEKKEVKK